MVATNAHFICLRADSKIEIPLYLNTVNAGATGFPSPADDYLQTSLDLNEYLNLNKEATFFCKASGYSMEGFGIFDGDILVIDRSIKPSDGYIVVCNYNGEFLVKKLELEFGRVALVSSHKDYPPIVLSDDNELIIFGVVKSAVKDFVKPKSKTYVRPGRWK